MTPLSESDLRLGLGHVLFVDIVGYSKLLIEKQKERLGQLTKLGLETVQVRESPDEQIVRLSTGDGMACNIAYFCANYGEADNAFAWLDKAVEYGDAGLGEIAPETCSTRSTTTQAGCRSCASMARRRSDWRRSTSRACCPNEHAKRLGVGVDPPFARAEVIYAR